MQTFGVHNGLSIVTLDMPGTFHSDILSNSILVCPPNTIDICCEGLLKHFIVS
jgi:hypothetical protein